MTQNSSRENQSPKKMGRPQVYTSPRRPRLLQLSDELVEAIDTVAGDGQRNKYIEEHLRAIPEIATQLARKE
jgi:hypothetical protein